jgi:hypothetical protein
MNKRILLVIAFFGFGLSNIFATNYSYNMLYKDPKVMSRGGANVAIGGSNSAVFSNPAGLSQFKDKDLDVSILNIGVITSASNVEFTSDIMEAIESGGSDNDKIKSLLAVFEEYAGQTSYLEINDFTAVGSRFGNFGIALGLVGVGSFNMKTQHSGFGEQGLLNVEGAVFAGPTIGASYSLMENKLHAGLGVKFLQKYGISNNFTASEIVENKDDMLNYLEEKMQNNQYLTFDAGLLYDIDQKLKVGVSYMNIGGIGEENEAFYIPETIDVGASYSSRLVKDSDNLSFTLGVDLVDLTNAYGYPDSTLKRLRWGGNLNIIDESFMGLSIAGGMYQTEYTAGVNFRLAIVEIALSTYAEEMGAYAGQDPDRRYMLNIRVGW